MARRLSDIKVYFIIYSYMSDRRPSGLSIYFVLYLVYRSFIPSKKQEKDTISLLGVNKPNTAIDSKSLP